MSASVGSNKESMARLKPVQPKVVWGSRSLGLHRNNLMCLNDHEYVMPVGCGLLHFENTSLHTRRARMVHTSYPEVEKVLLMCLSKDCQYLATVVAMKNQHRNDIHLVIFNTKGHMENNIRPRHVKYSAVGAAGIPLPMMLEQLQVTAMDFSHDSMYLACGTNFTSVGTLVFDHLKGSIYQTIISESIPQSLSFHPTDSGKMIVTGVNNFVKFWRFTAKSVHVAPVLGLRRGNFTYSTHAWLPPYAESTVVIGSDSGFLSILQNCEQRAPSHQAFGSAEYGDPQFTGVAHLIVRGDNILAASPRNEMVLYEVRRVILSKGIAGLTATLFPLALYKLDGVNFLHGLDFALKSSVTSYSLIAATDRNVVSLEIISDHDLSGGNEHRKKSSDGDVWATVSADKELFCYHSSAIQSMSISSKGNVFMTTSFHDSTVRMWDFDDPSTFKSSWLIESFSERSEENPFHADLHPSGLQIAAASESEVREYAVADSQLDLIRRFPVRAPFQSSNGQPVVISQPVSLVKYSNGGHLLAVVTGKVVQIFHMFVNDLEGSVPGSPCRVMALCDHVSTVTDIAFMRDDNRMVTISSDGCVYSWVMGGTGREKEYIQKGIAATRLSVSIHHPNKCMIAVCFEGAAVETVQTLAADVVRRRRQTSIAVRSSSRTSFDGNSFLKQLSDARDATASPTGVIHPLFTNETSASHQPVSNSGPKNYFVALWENEISINPILAFSDIPIKAIALGRLAGPDSVDICVLGLGDGRVLISTFPIPLITINPVNVSTTISNSKSQLYLNTSTGSRPNTKRRKNTNMPAESHMMGSIIDSSNSNSGLQKGFPPTDSQMVENSSTIHSPNRTGGGALVEDGSIIDKKNVQYSIIDESNCKIFRLFVGGITHVGFCLNGEWIFVAGEDTSIQLISTLKKAPDDLSTKPSSNTEISASNIQQFLMMDKAKMQQFRSKLLELESAVEVGRKENELYVTKLLDGKQKQMQELESKLNKEIQKRDENILTGRKEYLQMKRSMQTEVNNLKNRGDEALSAMELMYEKKLAQEAVYLEKMKQAYDEYVVHSRMDMTNLQAQTESKIHLIEQDKMKSLHEAERQKIAVLQYYEYIKDRNDEVLQSLEEQQAEERMKLRVQLTDTNTMLSQAQALNMAGEVQASRTIQKLKVDIENKDMEVLRVNSDIDWGNERISKLEQALDKATTELKARSDLVERWETKTVELSKKIEDLEKIRKTLTTQLNLVQGELEPKQKELTKATDKLQEMNREYEISLHAITEKEKVLGQKAENLMALQKQVRELRTTAAQKEAALRRAAMSLEEFVYSMNEARFAPFPKNEQGRFIIPTKGNNDFQNHTTTDDRRSNNKPPSPKAKKKPSSADGLLAALNLEPAVDSKLKRLHDILKPYLQDGGTDNEYVDEMEAVRKEQERHVTILHRNFHNLQSSLDSAHQAATNKVANHLTDNQTLLNEVNNLRMEVKSLSLENHRLSAQMDYQATRHAAELHTKNSLLLNSETDERYTPGGGSSKRKSIVPPQQQQQQLPQPPIASTSMTLPKINGSGPVTSFIGQGSIDDSVDTGSIALESQTSTKNSKKSKAKHVPSIDELLGAHSSSVKSPGDHGFSKRSESTPLLALGSAISSSSQLSSTDPRASSAAEKKIAAIIELNLQELKKGKKPKTLH